MKNYRSVRLRRLPFPNEEESGDGSLDLDARSFRKSDLNKKRNLSNNRLTYTSKHLSKIAGDV